MRGGAPSPSPGRQQPLAALLLLLLSLGGAAPGGTAVTGGSSASPQITLRYFDIRGLGEPIRLTLAALGLPWEEVRYAKCGDGCPAGVQDWTTAKAAGVMSGALPFGQVPALRYDAGEGDRIELVQTLAILRYVSRRHGFYGQSAAEEAAIDVVLGGVVDMRGRYTSLVYDVRVTGDPSVLAAYRETLTTWLGYLEGLLSRAGDGRFFVGERFSVADTMVYDILEHNLRLQPHCLSPFPLLAHFQPRIGRQPGIREYRMDSTGRRHEFANGGRSSFVFPFTSTLIRFRRCVRGSSLGLRRPSPLRHTSPHSFVCTKMIHTYIKLLIDASGC